MMSEHASACQAGERVVEIYSSIKCNSQTRNCSIKACHICVCSSNMHVCHTYIHTKMTRKQNRQKQRQNIVKITIKSRLLNYALIWDIELTKWGLTVHKCTHPLTQEHGIYNLANLVTLSNGILYIWCICVSVVYLGLTIMMIKFW